MHYMHSSHTTIFFSEIQVCIPQKIPTLHLLTNEKKYCTVSSLVPTHIFWDLVQAIVRALKIEKECAMSRNPWLLILAFLLGIVSPAWAATPAQTGYSVDQLGKISEIQSCLRGGEKMKMIGAITEPQLKDSEKRCLAELNAKLGTRLSREEVLKIPTGNMPNLTALQRAAGYITWNNTVWLFSVITLVVCIGIVLNWLGVKLKEIPKELYELACYVGGPILIYRASQAPIQEMEALLGSGLVLIGLLLTRHRMKERLTHQEIIIPGIMCLVFSIAAIATLSSTIGYFAILALIVALGFSVIVLPGTYIFGYEKDDAVVRGTSASFILLTIFAGLQLMGKTIPYLTLFADGVWLVAGIVGYLGLLIMSDRWYWIHARKNCDNRRPLGYLAFQIITVLACFIGMCFGSIFHVSAIQKIAGTFLVLWALEKPFEIKVEEDIYYAVAGIGVSGALYWLCSAGASRPELIQFMLPF